MLELICHQSYTWNGVPADKSPYRNHGTATDTTGGPDGFEPGSGVIEFPQSNSRVQVKPGISWRPIIALRVEALIKVDPMLHPTCTLVAGDGAFRFGVSEGALEAGFENASGQNNYIRSADAYAPDRRYHQVPANRWVRVTFDHDGFAKMRLLIDGEVVAERIVDGGIRSVGSQGIFIGNLAPGGDPFFGELDELKIWRLDPNTIKREFLGRPFTRKSADCWEKLARALLAWMRDNEERFKSFNSRCASQHNRVMRQILLLPEDQQTNLKAATDAVARLWFSGDLTGQAMATALCDWARLLGKSGIDAWDDPEIADLIDELKAIGLGGDKIAECDTEFAGFAELMEQAIRTCGRGKAA